MGTRNESIRVSLQDAGVESGMVKMAAATALFERALNDLDGETVKVSRSSKTAARDIEGIGASARKSGPDIDKLSGRLGLAARAVAAFGPAAVPLTTAVIPAVTALGGQMSAAALAGGVLVAAFNGVGDALEAVNKYRLTPTTENLAAAREAMSGLSREARQAVRALADLRPILLGIRDAGAAGFFPGFVEGLDDFERLAPTLERIFNTVGGAAGGLFEGALDELSSEEWAPFLEFVEVSAPAALTTLGQTVGNLTKGVAELWMAMSPLSGDFSAGLLQASERFEAWAEGVSQTEGYREFIDYVRETGPQVLETVGSLADAILQIGEAAAPLGGPVLQIIEGFADAVATIADSPIGPPLMAAVTAMSALSLATKVFGSASATSWATAARGANGYVAQLSAVRSAAAGLGKSAALVGGMTLATSDLGESMGITNTAMYASMGYVAGPWGAAIGGGIGLVMDLGESTEDATRSLQAFTDEMQRAASSGGLSGDQLDAAAAKYRELAAQVDAANMQLADNSGGWDGPQRRLAQLKNGLEGLFGSSDEEERARALSDAGEALARVKRASAEAAAQEARALGYSSAAARDHVLALRELHHATVRSLNAELDWKQSLLDANKTVKENGRVFDENGRALKGHRQAAIDSERAITRVASAWNVQATSGKASAAELEQTKAALRRMGTEAGLGETKIRELIGALDAVPPKTQTTLEVLTQQYKIAAFQAAIDALHGKTVDIFVRQSYTQIKDRANELVDAATSGAGVQKKGSDYRFDALGGFYPEGVQVFARGGIRERANQHLPEMANGRTIRVWNEPETKGETYIPHANDHRRPAAKRYLEKTAELFGGGVEWHAVGGFKAGHAAGLRDDGRRLVGESPTGLTSAASVKVEAQIDYERLAAAISHLRPVAGNINIQPHNYNEFLREEAQMRRLAGSDGVRA